MGRHYNQREGYLLLGSTYLGEYCLPFLWSFAQCRHYDEAVAYVGRLTSCDLYECVCVCWLYHLAVELFVSVMHGSLSACVGCFVVKWARALLLTEAISRYLFGVIGAAGWRSQNRFALDIQVVRLKVSGRATLGT